MISIRMPLDLRPCCDYHPSTPMDLVLMQLVPGVGEPWQPAFVCSRPGCPRHYSVNVGYFNTFKQRIDPDRVTRVACPHDGLAMYIAGQEGDAPQPMSVWKCAQHGCSGNAVMATAAAKAG